MTAEPIHLQPTALLAERVLLPGDPGRALRMAQALLSEPRMFNHNRGLWGYTGAAGDGELLTIQSTGMGGPSAAIVITELAQLGARRLVRVGTCGALDPAIELGSLLVAREAITGDGCSRALSGASRVDAGAALSSALVRGDPELRAGTVISTDLFYDNQGSERDAAADGAIAIEMETATLFALAARLELQAASLLIVSDVLFPSRTRIGTDALLAAEVRAGEVAATALVNPG